MVKVTENLVSTKREEAQHLAPGASRVRTWTLCGRLGGAARVFVFLAVLALSMVGLSYRIVRADVERSVATLGEHLLRELGPELVGEEQGLVLNGQQVFFSSKVTTMHLEEVLQLLQQNCEKVALPNFIGLPELPAHIQGTPVPSALRHKAHFAISRRDAEEGAGAELACLAHSPASRGAESFIQNALRFFETGNLAELGMARYFMVRKQDDKHTLVLSLWTEGDFDLFQFFTETGDAAGSDSPSVVRPPQSRRTFSATVPGRTYALRLYETALPSEQIFAFYDQRMFASGWRRGAVDGFERIARSYVRPSHLVLIVVDPSPSAGGLVSIVETAGPGFAEVMLQRQRHADRGQRRTQP